MHRCLFPQCMKSFFSVITNATKLRSITKRARVSHSFLSHSSSVDEKNNLESVRNSTVVDFSFLFFDVQLKKKNSRFIFSILFPSSTITNSTSTFSNKRKLAFVSVYRFISYPKIFRNYTIHNKGLKSNKFDASRIEECVPLSYK